MNSLILTTIYFLLGLIVLLVAITLLLSIYSIIKLFRSKDFSKINDIILKSIVVQSLALIIGFATYLASPNQAELAAKYNLPYIDLGIFKNTDNLDLTIRLYDKYLNEITGEQGELLGNYKTHITFIEIVIDDPRLDQKLRIGGSTWNQNGELRENPEMDGIIGRVDPYTTSYIEKISLGLGGELNDQYKIVYSGLFSNGKGATIKNLWAVSGEKIGGKAGYYLDKIKINIRRK